MEKLYRVKMNENGMPNFSTAEEVEPKHGEWIFQECTDEIYGRAYECSICGVAVVGNHHHFCPNCGAKMV